MRVVHWAIETAAGRLVAAALFGTRIASNGWTPPPEPPDAVVERISPTPLLIVHGDADRFFPTDHARWLATAAREPIELWLEPGFGHAEVAASADLVARIARWAHAAAPLPRPLGGGAGPGGPVGRVDSTRSGDSARMRR